MTLQEMQLDLANTESDITALTKITEGLATFTSITGGEDRSAFRMDHFKYSGLLAQANQLRARIVQHIEAHNKA